MIAKSVKGLALIAGVVCCAAGWSFGADTEGTRFSLSLKQKPGAPARTVRSAA